jgi:endoglucanase
MPHRRNADQSHLTTKAIAAHKALEKLGYPRRVSKVYALVVTGVVAALTVPVWPAAGPAGSASAKRPAPAVHVKGNRLVNGSGRTIRLLGVDRSGTEYACVQGWGIFDGPSSATSIDAIRAWHVNAVRVPLNEDCWLGINGVKENFAGAAYRQAIKQYVKSLNAAGLVAVLDLHWSAPGAEPASGQQVMADASHSVAFWSSVARSFRSNAGVLFDLYNEPHDIGWSCWRNGCTAASGWKTAGMQQLLDAVRRAGAKQPVLVAGLNWAGDLSGWLGNAPTDPLHQLVASLHIYNFSACNTASCWNQTVARVARSVPVVTGELGENDCASGFVRSYMRWADRHRVSYLAWTWDTWDCRSGPALISSYAGTPTPYGAGFKQHLAALARNRRG